MGNQSDLKAILSTIEVLVKPTLVSKIFKHAEHSQELSHAKDTLDHSFKIFQVILTIQKLPGH